MGFEIVDEFETPPSTGIGSPPSKNPSDIPGIIRKPLQYAARAAESFAGTPGNIYESLVAGGRRQAAEQDIESLQIPEDMKETLRGAQKEYKATPDIPTTSDVREYVTKPFSKIAFGTAEGLEPQNKTEEFFGKVAESVPFLFNQQNGIAKGIFKAIGRGTAGKGAREIAKYLGGEDKAQTAAELLTYGVTSISPKTIKNAINQYLGEWKTTLEEAPSTQQAIPQTVKKSWRNIDRQASGGSQSAVGKKWIREKAAELEPIMLGETADVNNIYKYIQDLNDDYRAGAIRPTAKSFYHDVKKEVLEPLMESWGKANAPEQYKNYLAGKEMFMADANASLFRNAVNNLANKNTINFATRMMLLGYPFGVGKAATAFGAGHALGTATDIIEPFLKSNEIKKLLGKTVAQGIAGNIPAVITNAERLNKKVKKKAPKGFVIAD